MIISQRFITFLAVTTSLILIADRIKAKKTRFHCNGELLDKNLGSRKFHKFQHNLSDIKLPERFSPTDKWPYCKSLYHVKDQGECGGCWAFASASAMSDRLCIATQGKYNEILSEQDLMECCKYCVAEGKEKIGGCNGGYSIEAFKYWEDHGMVTGYQGCKPTNVDVIKGIPQKECRERCTNESYKVQYEKDLTFSVKTFMTNPAQKDDIKHIMAEIMLNGPVVGGMKTYNGYISDVPTDGILKVDQSLENKDEGGGHAIKIFGWDYVNGTPVWIIANSWGKDWCDRGFCYVRRGQNDFKMEVRFYAGVPKIHTTKKKQKQIEKTETSGSNIIKITNLIELVVILCILTM